MFKKKCQPLWFSLLEQQRAARCPAGALGTSSSCCRETPHQAINRVKPALTDGSRQRLNCDCPATTHKHPLHRKPQLSSNNWQPRSDCVCKEVVSTHDTSSNRFLAPRAQFRKGGQDSCSTMNSGIAPRDQNWLKKVCKHTVQKKVH